MSDMLLFQSVGMDSVDPDTIFVGVLGFMWAEFLLEAYIGLQPKFWINFEIFVSGRRQRAVYREHTSAPPELEGILDQDTFTKARLYALEKSQFGAVQGIFSQLLSTLLLWVLGYRLFWGWAMDTLDALGQVVNTSV